MNIYIVIEIILAILALLCNGKNKRIIFVVSALLLLMLTCLNDGTGDVNNCGYDLPEYIKFFKGENSIYGSITWRSYYVLEWPYYYYCKLLRLIGDTDFVYILATGLTYGLPFLYVVKKKSQNPALSIFLLLTIFNTWTYLFFISVHRQMLANTFIFLAYILIESKYVYRKQLAALSILMALASHSSSFFVVPILFLLYFFKFNIKKKRMIDLFIATFFLGMVMNYITTYVFKNIFYFLANFETISRATSYIPHEKSIFEDFKNQVPFFLNILFLLYFASDRIDKFFIRCLFVCGCTYNLLFMLPLINRSLTTILLLSIAGAIPDISKMRATSMYKSCLTGILLANIFIAYLWYQNYYCRIVPFYFIWEQHL